MTTLSLQGSTISYTTLGKGPPFVLLHGASNDGNGSFGHIVSHFSDVRTVVLPDYAGCGNSTLPQEELTLDLLVEQMIAIIRHIDQGPVDLLGASLGSQVAAVVASKYPELVRRLILIGGHADSKDPRHELIFETWLSLERLNPRLSNRYFLSLGFSPQGLNMYSSEQLQQFLERKIPPFLHKRLALALQMDIREALTKIIAPTLVVGMTHDYRVPVRHARAMHRLIPGSRYVQMDSGHAVFHEQSDAISQLIRNFLLEASS